MTIDFRSDTVTRPTAGMLEAMFNAPVGDDVFGEDPSVNKLEQATADYFGMEAGIFCPSGTMTNQVAIKVHTQPGDEVICDETAHVYQYEGGGIALNAGASVKLLQGARGLLTAEQVRSGINADDVHKARTSLVCLENTSNRGGGSCYDMSAIAAIRQVCDEAKMPLHLDGARLFNALVAKQQDPKEYGRLFHSISICFSKGLGTPVGSVLIGDQAFIKRARRFRKVFGGGMRQAGYLAAAGIYALENHINRISEDHQHAQLIAKALEKMPYVKRLLPVETNIIIFELTEGRSAPEMVTRFKEQGLLFYAISPTQIRLVTHLDITPEMVQRTIQVIESF